MLIGLFGGNNVRKGAYMKKICILGTSNLKHMTLISHYTDKLDELNIDYDVIYIDKYGDNESINARKKHVYRLKIKREWSFGRKLIRYWRFKKFAIDIINSNNYDFIIVWGSFTAFMFSMFLGKKYKKRYCINIRDYAYEKIKIIYFIMKFVIKNSSFTTISSEGFKIFLPKYDYTVLHSLNEHILSSCNRKARLRDIDEPIRISFIGYVRFYENNKKFIDALGNDNRFILQFFGEGSDVLQEYSRDKGYSNVICEGRFEPHETFKYLEKTDIINNLYGTNDIALDTALSIRLYYTGYLYIPILVFNGTYMQKICNEFGIGYAINNINDNIADDIYNWYRNINFDLFQNNCNQFINKVKLDNERFLEDFNRHILNKGI